MKRVLKLSLPILVVIEAILLSSGVIDLKAAIVLVAVIEIMLMLVAAKQIFSSARVFKDSRQAGKSIWMAIENSFEIFMPRPIARAALSEIKLFYYLGRWLLRKNHLLENQFSYYKRSSLGGFIIVLLLTTPVEVGVIELFIPWIWLKWVLGLVAVLALFWMYGFYASLIGRPHRLEGNMLALSYGILADAEIPYANIASLEMSRSGSGMGEGWKLIKTPVRQASC